MKKSVFDASVEHYVFSRKPPDHPAPGVQFVSEPVEAFARRLRAAPGKHIWLMGGGEIIASFLDAGEIDEFDIHVIPTLIGDGIPLIARRHRDVALRLIAFNDHQRDFRGPQIEFPLPVRDQRLGANE